MKAAAILLALAALAGLMTSPPPDPTPPRMGGYTVLAGDFHIHMFPLDETTLAPWDVVWEARRRGLDVIALTGHNQVWTGKLGRWYANRTGGPLVLPGQEIITPTYDMIAVGVQHNVDWRGTAAESAARIHQQGGVAIAAHPVRSYWPAYDDAAMQVLDGAEVMHPMAFVGPGFAAELREFYQRRPLAAIGSSDFHVNRYPGFSRTFVFVREVSAPAVIDAIRSHRTVVVDREGRMYGDSTLIRLAESNGGLPRSGVPREEDAWSRLSRLAALAGLVVAFLFAFRR